MSDSEEPFQVVKHKKFRRKHIGRAQQNRADQESCHADNDIVEPSSVLEKLNSYR